MRIFGHPLHLMLVHFPAALFPMDLVCSLLARFTGNATFVQAAYWAMVGGTLMGLLALLTGAADLLRAVEEKPALLRKLLWHGGINGTVLCGYALLTWSAYGRYPEAAADGTAVLFVKGGLNALMLFGNYLGGSLVLKDKLGVENQQT